MKCRHIVDLLGPYLDGECSLEERRKVEEHLRRCPACRSELEQLRRIETAGRRTVPPDPGEQYWSAFLPRLRQRIGQEQRHPVPVGLGDRIRRWFSPPVPWVRLAGAMATAVLVVVIGRAFIQQKDDLAPMGRPGGQPSTDRVIPTGKNIEEMRFVADSVTADREKQIPGEIFGTGTETHPPVKLPGAQRKTENEASPEKAVPETVLRTEKSIRQKKGQADRQFVPPPTPPSEPSEPFPGAEDAAVKEEITALSDAPVDVRITADRATGTQIRSMARSTEVRDWRGQIQHWETVIDSSSDESILATAHVALARSWHRLVMAEPDQDNITAALQIHRTALEYAAEDSVQQLLEQQISEIEDRLQKK